MQTAWRRFRLTDFLNRRRASVLPDRQSTAWISAQRPPGTARPDPGKPNAVFLERERGASGRIVESAVVLLTSKECPWRCLMCDLWKHTTTQAVPAGAIPAQIAQALQTLAGRKLPRDSRLVEEGQSAMVDQIKLNDGLTSAGVAATDAFANALDFRSGEAAWRRLLVPVPSLGEI